MRQPLKGTQLKEYDESIRPRQLSFACTFCMTAGVSRLQLLRQGGMVFQ